MTRGDSHLERSRYKRSYLILQVVIEPEQQIFQQHLRKEPLQEANDRFPRVSQDQRALWPTMSYPKKESLVNYGDWDEKTDTHPAMKFMHAYTNKVDEVSSS